jgi:hypothetical protein
MPIRFRCVYCNQLLGISRRKAGTIVRCTSCEGQLIVPDPGDAESDAAEPSPRDMAADQPPESVHPVTSPEVFAASEFDAFLEPLSQAGGAVASPPAPLVERPAPSPQTTALVLSRRALALAVIAEIALIALVFAGGLFLGLHLR